MGMFAVIFSIVIVIIQTSSILMDRSAHDWSYPLLKVSPNSTYLAEVNKLFHSKSQSNSTALLDFVQGIVPHVKKDQLTQNDSIVTVDLYAEHLSSLDTQAACLHAAWKNTPALSKFPTFCLFNIHTKQKIDSILADFNPHLMLLVLAVLHSTLIMSKMNKIVWTTLKPGSNTSFDFENPHKFSVPISFAAFCLVIIIVYVIVDGRKHDLVQYPTIIATVILLMLGIWFLVREKAFKDDHLWFCVFHLHLVSIPTAVLAISLVGSRFWTDIVAHIVLLSVAANVLILEKRASDLISRKLCQLLYFFIPLFCLYMAHLQWGANDNWKYSIGIMGSASLLPFFIFPVFINDENDSDKSYKHLSKIILFTSSGALVSLIINLAMFSK
jgi:hypothetical protein